MKLLHNAKPVYVEWVDSMQTFGWHQHEHLKKPVDMRCVTVGHLISKDKNKLQLSLNLSNSSVGQIIEIPTFSVKKIKRLVVK